MLSFLFRTLFLQLLHALRLGSLAFLAKLFQFFLADLVLFELVFALYLHLGAFRRDAPFFFLALMIYLQLRFLLKGKIHGAGRALPVEQVDHNDGPENKGCRYPEVLVGNLMFYSILVNIIRHYAAYRNLCQTY